MVLGLVLGLMLGLAGGSSVARADDLAAARADLAPGGRLRAALNLGNPVLAQRTDEHAAPTGVSVELAAALGQRLGVPVDLVVFREAGEVTDAAERNVWDVGFLAIDPKRATTITFSPPYVVIEGSYLVPSASAYTASDQVDRPGVRVGVAVGSGYDLYLTRALHAASLVRERNVAVNIASLRAGTVDVVGGLRSPLDAVARDSADVRVLPGRFMVVEQAMATPRGHAAGAAYVAAFIEAMKASGFVADALRRTGQSAAAVVPATQ